MTVTQQERERFWEADGAEVLMPTAELPDCCRRVARDLEGEDAWAFECPVCGALWWSREGKDGWVLDERPTPRPCPPGCDERVWEAVQRRMADLESGRKGCV